MKEYLEKVANLENMIVMFTDSYDVLLYNNQASIVRIFKEFSANVIFGAEYLLFPEKDIIHSYPTGPGGKYFVRS